MNNFLKDIQIGNITTKGNIFLAPMAGVTDLPFREICRELGAGLVYSELISSKGIVYESENTKKLTETSDIERPVTIQLFGADPETIAKAATMIEDLPFDILDINMGCPVPKVVKHGEGAGLLADYKHVGKLVKKVSEAIKKPMTVKIRKGIDGKVTAVDVAKAAEENGAKAIAVHGRMREQYYEGLADLEIVARVKEAVTIPVIHSGDVVDVDSAMNVFNVTKCDAIMIGRGTFGNPWVFSEINHFLKTGERLAPPSKEDKINKCLEHAKRLIEYKGEYTAIREMRRHTGHYIKGMKGAAALRAIIGKIESYEDLKAIIENL
ncbi:MAG: tRNA dihydrouridine synthase DusB [Defluviitaleaceae bacterium]|nr:tRNA dihydrouridine synthase DusB [Defluviitaleaceae bacterium]